MAHNHLSLENERKLEILKSLLTTAQIATLHNGKSPLDNATLEFSYASIGGEGMFLWGFGHYVPSVSGFSDIQKFLLFYILYGKVELHHNLDDALIERVYDLDDIYEFLKRYKA